MSDEPRYFRVENHGPLIVATNYWESDLARTGKLYCSVNAGAIRLLIPPQYQPALNAMRGAEYVILSRAPWPAVGAEGIELLFEDRSDEPYCLHLTPASFDLLPASRRPAGSGS